jgi:type VI protein secretion system component VasF
MVNRPPNPAPKPSAANKTKKQIVKKPKKIVKTSQVPTQSSQADRRLLLRRKVKTQQNSSGLASKMAIAILLGSACLVAAFAWISIELMINPDKMTWLNQLLPAWVQSASEQ